MTKVSHSVFILILAMIIDTVLNQVLKVSLNSPYEIKVFLMIVVYYLLAYRLMKKHKFLLAIIMGVIIELSNINTNLIYLTTCILLAFFVDSIIKRLGSSFVEKMTSIILSIVFYQLTVYLLSWFFNMTNISIDEFITKELLLNFVFGLFSTIFCLWIETLIEEKRLKKDLSQRKQREHISLLDKGE